MSHSLAHLIAWSQLQKTFLKFYANPTSLKASVICMQKGYKKKDFALLYPKEGYRLWIFYFKSFFQNTQEKQWKSEECFFLGLQSRATRAAIATASLGGAARKPLARPAACLRQLPSFASFSSPSCFQNVSRTSISISWNLSYNPLSVPV